MELQDLKMKVERLEQTSKVISVEPAAAVNTKNKKKKKRKQLEEERLCYNYEGMRSVLRCSGRLLPMRTPSVATDVTTVQRCFLVATNARRTRAKIVRICSQRSCSKEDSESEEIINCVRQGRTNVGRLEGRWLLVGTSLQTSIYKAT